MEGDVLLEDVSWLEAIRDCVLLRGTRPRFNVPGLVAGIKEHDLELVQYPSIEGSESNHFGMAIVEHSALTFRNGAFGKTLRPSPDRASACKESGEVRYRPKRQALDLLC